MSPEDFGLTRQLRDWESLSGKWRRRYQRLYEQIWPQILHVQPIIGILAQFRLFEKKCPLVNRNEVALPSPDECDGQQHGIHCKMWISPNATVGIQEVARDSVAYLASISLYRGKFIRAIFRISDATALEAFVKELLRHRSRIKKMVVILGDACCHHEKLLKLHLKKHQHQFKRLFRRRTASNLHLLKHLHPEPSILAPIDERKDMLWRRLERYTYASPLHTP